MTDLPQSLTVHYGGYAEGALEYNREPPRADPEEWPLPLSALPSQVLQGFAVAYEAGSDASLSYSANVLRLLDERGVKLADLPSRSRGRRRVVVHGDRDPRQAPLAQIRMMVASRWPGC